MKSVVKIPLEMTPEQAAVLESQSKIANWLYNKLLEQARRRLVAGRVGVGDVVADHG